MRVSGHQSGCCLCWHAASPAIEGEDECYYKYTHTLSLSLSFSSSSLSIKRTISMHIPVVFYLSLCLQI